LDAARDLAVMHIEARNDSFGDHETAIETAPGVQGNLLAY
jgi:hypothetical protein